MRAKDGKDSYRSSRGQADRPGAHAPSAPAVIRRTSARAPARPAVRNRDAILAGRPGFRSVDLMRFVAAIQRTVDAWRKLQRRPQKAIGKESRLTRRCAR